MASDHENAEVMEKVATQIQNLHSRRFGDDHKINWSYYDVPSGEADGKCAVCGVKFKIRLKLGVK